MFERVLIVFAAVPAIAVAAPLSNKQLAFVPYALGSNASISAVLDAVRTCHYDGIRAETVQPDVMKVYVGGSMDHIALDCTKAWMREHWRQLRLERPSDAPIWKR